MRKVSAVAGNFFRPVVDGRTLLDHPFTSRSLSQNPEMPLMMGTCEDEMTFPLGTDPTNFRLTDAEAHKRIRDYVGINDVVTEHLYAGWKKNHPTASPSDIMFSILSDYQYRRSQIRAAEARASLNAGPVFMYLFTWKTKMEGGQLKTPHTMCLAFSFGNVDVAAGLLGTGPDVDALATRVMDAWIAFAKSGDPNHRDIPLWRPYSELERSTMIFDNECIAVGDPKSRDRLMLDQLPLFVPVDCRPKCQMQFPDV